MRNTALDAAISTIMSTPVPAQYKASLDIVSSSGNGFTFSPMIIDAIDIDQSFGEQYGDDIHVHFRISTAEYAQLYDNAQNLMATLTLTPLDYQGRTILTYSPFVKQYRAMIVDLFDPRKQVVDAQLRTTPDMHTTVQLVDQTLYNLRYKAFHQIIHTATMQQAITYATKVLGLDTVQAVTPDNINRYDHVIFPPNVDITNALPYLHSTYGVYMKGLSYYFYNGILYVYPPFELNPSGSETLHVYQAEQGQWAGAGSFHQVVGTDIKIVSNEMPKIQDLSITASENVGTGVMFIRSSKLVDSVVQSDNTNGVTYTDDIAMTVKLNQQKMLNSQYQNMKYAKATDNEFVVGSLLAEHQTMILTVVWPSAIPFSILPGMPVTYNSDYNGSVNQKSGIVEGYKVRMERRERVDSDVRFVTKGWLKLRVDPTGVTTTTVN